MGIRPTSISISAESQLRKLIFVKLFLSSLNYLWDIYSVRVALLHVLPPSLITSISVSAESQLRKGVSNMLYTLMLRKSLKIGTTSPPCNPDRLRGTPRPGVSATYYFRMPYPSRSQRSMRNSFCSLYDVIMSVCISL